MKVYVGKKLVELFGSECPLEIKEMDGIIYEKSDRHFLHKTVGKLGNNDCIDFFDKSQNEMQSIISSRDLYAMLDCGLLQICSPIEFAKQMNNSKGGEAKKQRFIAGINKISESYYLPCYVQTAIIKLFENA